MSKISNDISSAEITAYYRSAFDNISCDNISHLLVSSEGVDKAKTFSERYNYPLVYRKISLRAGFFYREALSLLNTGEYDSCISFASGFSALNYLIKRELADKRDITFVDSDLEYILKEREFRLDCLTKDDSLDINILSNIISIVLDLEDAASKSLSLKEIFPNFHKPLFLIEGIVYFLSPKCLNWLIDEIASYNSSAIIIDYWPENSLLVSECFSRTFKDLKDFIPEKTKSFWNVSVVNQFNKRFLTYKHLNLIELDQIYSNELQIKPEMIDQNLFFPLHLIIGKSKIS